jgi:hypothetical protein
VLRRRAGFRVAVLVTLAAWLLSASHFAALGIEVSRVFAGIGMALFDTAVVWLTYLGLEPYMRRYSPDSILGWTTLVSGRWRDPRVGVDVMIGLAAGLGMTILYAAHNLIPTFAGRVEPMPFAPNIDTLNGLRFIFAAIARQLSAALTSGLLGVAGIVGFVLLFKRRTDAAVTRREGPRARPTRARASCNRRTQRPSPRRDDLRPSAGSRPPSGRARPRCHRHP